MILYHWSILRSLARFVSASNMLCIISPVPPYDYDSSSASSLIYSIHINDTAFMEYIMNNDTDAILIFQS